jgi:hypothetical protein
LVLIEARSAPHDSVSRPRGRINIAEVAEPAADDLLLILADDRLERSSRQNISVLDDRENDDRRADGLES